MQAVRSAGENLQADQEDANKMAASFQQNGGLESSNRMVSSLPPNMEADSSNKIALTFQQNDTFVGSNQIVTPMETGSSFTNLEQKGYHTSLRVKPINDEEILTISPDGKASFETRNGRLPVSSQPNLGVHKTKFVPIKPNRPESSSSYLQNTDKNPPPYITVMNTKNVSVLNERQPNSPLYDALVLNCGGETHNNLGRKEAVKGAVATHTITDMGGASVAGTKSYSDVIQQLPLTDTRYNTDTINTCSASESRESVLSSSAEGPPTITIDEKGTVLVQRYEESGFSTAQVCSVTSVNTTIN